MNEWNVCVRREDYFADEIVLKKCVRMKEIAISLCASLPFFSVGLFPVRIEVTTVRKWIKQFGIFSEDEIDRRASIIFDFRIHILYFSYFCFTEDKSHQISQSAFIVNCVDYLPLLCTFSPPLSFSLSLFPPVHSYAFDGCGHGLLANIVIFMHRILDRNRIID